MVFKFLTLDEVELEGKTVFLRADINSPLDPSSKRILDASRISSIAHTLRDLKGAKIVLGAHQSRPGKYDFTSLEMHARVLQVYHNGKVNFIDDIIGTRAQESIKGLKPDEVLVLDNLRMLEEENKNMPPEKLKNTRLVKTLSPYFDLTVIDAFAAAHRSQPSLVGFGETMPMVAGRLMQQELDAHNHILEKPDRPCICVLGGVKIEDRLPVMSRVLSDNISDRILVGGLIHEYFQMANGYIEKRKRSLSEEEGERVEKAADILEKYGDQIQVPVDVALDVEGLRVEVLVEKLTDETNMYDIGLNTIAQFSEQISKANTVVAEGPLGMFERQGFDNGTKELLKAMAKCDGFTLVGGGHLGGMASMMDLDHSMSHVSTGGGAMLTLLAGGPMPVLEALERSKNKYG